MSPVYNIPDIDDIEAEASAWIVQVDSGAMSKGDIEDLKEWISRSPQHKHSFQKMASGFLEIGTLLTQDGATTTIRERKPKKALFSAPVMLSMAATVIAGFFIFSGQFSDQPLKAAEPTVQYIANVGEQKDVTLADGSVVTLNTNSRIDVNFTGAERSINLAYGEALFDVAKDRSRPFVVHANQGAVRAVGTIFSVRSIKSEVSVLVEEGIVELIAPPIANQPGATTLAEDMVVLARLRTGEEANFDGVNKNIRSVEPADVANRHAWKNGMLIFDGHSLSEVVDEITRYTDMKIVISNPEMQDLQIGGTFKVGETEAFLDAMTMGFGLNAQRVSGDTVYLSQQN
jgi:transmembrane sensor